MKINNNYLKLLLVIFYLNFANVSFIYASIFLNGTYTIGGNNPDFLSIQDAANALNNNIVTGKVTFKIRNGIYDESVEFRKINRLTFYYPVIFTSESKKNSNVKITSDNQFTISLNNAEYIEFNYVTITNTNNNGTVIFKEENLLYPTNELPFTNSNIPSLSISNCDIIATNKSAYLIRTTSKVKGIYFKENLFQGGKGIKLGEFYKRYVENPVLIDNYFTEINGFAVQLINPDNTTINNNIFRQCDKGLKLYCAKQICNITDNVIEVYKTPNILMDYCNDAQVISNNLFQFYNRDIINEKNSIINLDKSSNTQINKNIFYTDYNQSIRMDDCKEIMIQSNTFDYDLTSKSTTVLTGIQGVEVYNSTSVTILNNMVTATSSVGNYYFSGLFYLFNSSDVDLFHNSIYLKSEFNSEIILHNYDSDVKLYNNIFFNDGKGYLIKFTDNDNITDQIKSDNNVLFTTTGNYINYKLKDYFNLSQWSVMGYDTHSLESNPDFLSSQDLHISQYSGALDKAKYLSDVSFDFDGETRGNSLRDIGADEATFLTSPNPVLINLKTSNESLEINNPNLITVYPNPFVEGIFIKLDRGKNENLYYKVFDIKGKLITINEFSEFHNENMYLDLSFLSNGAYWIGIYSDTELLTRNKIVKN